MHKTIKNLWFKSIGLLNALVLMASLSVQADDSVCAVVKIEILQELTLERQGFEAQLKIGNVLDDKTIENVDVDVWFKDENDELVLASSDPNNTDAQFFIRVQSMDNIDNVDGLGSIAAGEEAVVKWLIVPAPGASNGLDRGTLYFVGADFNYTLDGEADTIEVAPDTIYVKPMPLLTLDYFIPRNVVADDPFTDEVEAPEPFTLGVRVQNNGSGDAKSLKIDSAQPKIVENKQGLLINFELLSSYVGNEPVENSLLLDFGDIESNQSKVGRWQMQVSLSGKFTEFGATFTHASELGGELTSLMEATNTHFLLQDVVVDLPGRDSIRDFLADGLDNPRVYESDGTTLNVVDQSASSSFEYVKEVGEYSQYKLMVPESVGLFYTQVSDPFNGQKDIGYVTRSDGKSIHNQNAWLSKVQDSATHEWSHYINLFDGNGTDTYFFHYKERVIQPRPPVIQFIPQRVTYEGTSIGFIVEASDPDGDLISLSATNLPSGATFVDNGDGTGSFNWNISIGQAGLYSITYTATDGSHEAKRTASITVHPHDDIDGDGLNDDWEMEHFNTLEYDGYGDFDGDGISNQDEHDNDTNPAIPDGPTKPIIFSPEIDGESESLNVELTVDNGVYDGPHEIVYQFELYSDEGMTEKLAYYNAVPQGQDGFTSWLPGLELSDNTNYFWRVRAYDSFTYSEWVSSQFFVNTQNDLPTVPRLSFPSIGGKLVDADARLEVSNSTDIDNDQLYYEFTVYSDSELQEVIAESGVLEQGAADDGVTTWQLGLDLIDQKTYYWKVKVTDEHNEFVESEVFNFVWEVSNQPPVAPELIAPESGAEVEQLEPTLEVSSVTDPDGDQVTYYYELDVVNTFDSENLQVFVVDIDSDQLTQTLKLPELSDNQVYYWRVKAADSSDANSAWLTSSFFVNTQNDAPSLPVVNNPGDESWVDTLTPNLSVNPSTDIDNDQLKYHFEVYLDEGMNTLLQEYQVSEPEVMLTSLSDNTWYYWRARAVDDEGLDSGWTLPHKFFVNDNNFDDPPTLTWIEPSETIKATPNSDVILKWQDTDPDSSAQIQLYYSKYEDGLDPVFIAQDIQEDNDSSADTYTWNIGEIELGNYHVFARISDASSTIDVKAPAIVEAIPDPVIPGNIIVTSEPVLKLYESFDAPNTESFSIQLDKAPEAEVVIPIINPDSSRFDISESEVRFNNSNWDQAYTVTLTPINNCFTDNDEQLIIELDEALSDDPAFSGVKGDNVKAKFYNDDAVILNESRTAPSTEVSMCGLSKNIGFSLFGLEPVNYDLYFKNISGNTVSSVSLRFNETTEPVIRGFSTVSAFNLAPGAVTSGYGWFILTFYNKPEGDFVSPSWFTLEQR